jgi:Putative peptidoglycan binding domain
MASSARAAEPPYANAPRRRIRPAEPPAFTVEHSTDRRVKLTTDRRMNPRHEQEPFSLSELAAGSAAVAAVALIAFLGARASQPPSPPPTDISQAAPATAPSSVADVSQRRRHVPTATARARQGLPPNDVITRLSESSGADLPVIRTPASDPVATKGAAPSNFLVEAAPATVVDMRSPDIGGPPPPLIGPPDLFRTKDAISVRPSNPIREAAIPPPPEADRNPSNRSDAIWIQAKLHDLGYLAGNGSGVWGAASRSALRDFKAMNGLAEDDKWDRETEQRLLSKQNVPASSTFVGGWAQSVEECQHFRGVGAPLVIRSRGAETDSVKCSFRSIKRELATAWRIQAACSAGGQSWNANVSLKLAGSNLNWSSENGKETYVRCVKP